MISRPYAPTSAATLIQAFRWAAHTEVGQPEHGHQQFKQLHSSDSCHCTTQSDKVRWHYLGLRASTKCTSTPRSSQHAPCPRLSSDVESSVNARLGTCQLYCTPQCLEHRASLAQPATCFPATCCSFSISRRRVYSTKWLEDPSAQCSLAR